MASSTGKKYFCTPKIVRPKSQGESKSFDASPLRAFDPYDDECIRQYILYYYQFHKSEGFLIDWSNMDYRFGTKNLMGPYRAGRRTNNEIIREAACCAVLHQNAEKETRLRFVDHISASYRLCAGMLFWITFWARDLDSPSPEPKMYESKFRLCGDVCEIDIFRLRPTDAEIAAVQVDPPPPLFADDPERPTILFTVKGPGSGGSMSIPDVAFTRIPAQVSPDSCWS